MNGANRRGLEPRRGEFPLTLHLWRRPEDAQVFPLVQRQPRGGAATGFAGVRISCWMSPMAWNFSSPRVPYTTIGDPGLSATATPRRPERSTDTNCPSSTRTTTSWPATAWTVPRSSDQLELSVIRINALAEGFGSDEVIVVTGVTCSFCGSPRLLRFAGGPSSGWTVVAGAAATATGSALPALFGGSAAEGLTGPSNSEVVAGPEADDGAGGFVGGMSASARAAAPPEPNASAVISCGRAASVPSTATRAPTVSPAGSKRLALLMSA